MRTRPTEVYLYEWSVLAWTNSRTRLELDATGRGLFRELLDRCFTQGAVPKDPALICQIGAVTMEQFEVIWPKISRHFVQDKKDQSSLRNKRADAFRSDYFRYCKEQKQRRLDAVAKKKRTDATNHENQELANGTVINDSHDDGCNAKQPKTRRDEKRREETNSEKRREETKQEIENSASAPPLDHRPPARAVVQAIRDALNPEPDPLWESEIGDTTQRMLAKHPDPCDFRHAIMEFRAYLETSMNPDAVMKSCEANHALWCEHWTELRRAWESGGRAGRRPWVPFLAQFFTDGYAAKQPPARAAPKKSKDELMLERLSALEDSQDFHETR